jgi:hypothetical protein
MTPICRSHRSTSTAPARASIAAEHLAGKPPVATLPRARATKCKDKDFDFHTEPARLMLLKGGAAGESKVLIKGAPPLSGPVSTIPAQLQGATRATIQVRGSDTAACVSATLSNVTISDGTTFKAK